MLANLLTVTFLLPLLAIAAPAPAAAAKPSKLTRAFLTNCWTDPSDGARSEVDFFKTDPSNLGSATPDNISIASDGSNTEWESGGSVAVGDDTFTWVFPAGEGAKDQPDGAEVGSASLASGAQFTIIKESGQVVYTDGDFTCYTFYGAIKVPS